MDVHIRVCVYSILAREASDNNLYLHSTTTRVIPHRADKIHMGAHYLMRATARECWPKGIPASRLIGDRKETRRVEAQHYFAVMYRSAHAVPSCGDAQIRPTRGRLCALMLRARPQTHPSSRTRVLCAMFASIAFFSLLYTGILVYIYFLSRFGKHTQSRRAVQWLHGMHMPRRSV